MTVWLPEDNRTAMKLIHRLGFQWEGVIRKAHLRDGIYQDYHIFGILAEELLDSHSNGAGSGSTE
jgi:RimJ/RimL family protein N-acetyltransferase